MNIIKNFLPIIMAALSGMAMTFQGTFNSALGKKIGVIETSVVVHVIGLAVSILCVFFWGTFPKISTLRDVPYYSLLGGILGVVIVAGVAYTISRTGAAFGISIILIAQLVSAVVLDHFGIFTLERIPVDTVRIVGTLLMVIGAKLLAR
ncbi:DMT family transporter [Alkalicella caledoniensis]|uniref:DMT family transporter n=1 Tax=Alkalicella caledoniensis TaxID=2731377 RepID=A0A7G9WC75_ALKCA|nr:DMT family transporter [Alkalicella caledoniensis]QNO16287.1 DMT family transporter [Alkalicella caledoniensis]